MRVEPDKKIYAIHIRTGASIQFENLEDAVNSFNYKGHYRKDKRQKILRSLILREPYGGFIWSHTRGTEKRKVAVRCIELNKTFDSVREASIYTNRFRNEYKYLFRLQYNDYSYAEESNIVDCCNNSNDIRLTAGGLHWEYVSTY